ncbi:MAG: hypothetical protein ACPLKP_03330 [Microgenomates group bacterium]
MKDKILNSKYKKYFSLLIFSIFYLLFAIRAANAQNTTHLIVAPSRQEILVEPGETTAINIKFLNQTDAPIPGTVGAVDFIVEDKEGTPTFIEGTPVITGLTQISSRFSAASWFELPYDRATIPANGKVLIQAKIRVPVDARPGGRYVAIYFEPSTTPSPPSGLAKEGTTPVASRIVGLVYLRVAGPIKEDAYVVRFGGPNFSQYGPITILTEILNRGDYHITPKGVIKIYNMFNQEIDRQKLEEKNIFPDASRVYENKVGQKWMFGKYKAELSASYGETGKALTATTYFWVIPYKEIIAGVLAIAIIILLAIILYRRLIKRQLELQERVKELEKKLKEK